MKTKKFRLKQIEDAAGEVNAVIATLNVKDHDGDVTLPGAFGEQEVPIVPTHNWGSVPLGKAKIREDGDDVVAEMRCNLDIEDGRKWYSALKFDFENGPPKQEYSYGYDILESDRGTQDGEPVQLLKKLKVIEVSPVMLGAGKYTRTLEVKHKENPNGADSWSGMTMEQHAESVERALQSFVDRSKALAALREKEGRTLSRANKERLSRLRGMIAGIGQDIDTLLSESDADDPKAASICLSLLAMKMRARERFLQTGE